MRLRPRKRKTCPLTSAVHPSNIFKRESFRHHSYISPAATGVICGLGGHGYVLAIEAIAQHIDALD